MCQGSTTLTLTDQCGIMVDLLAMQQTLDGAGFNTAVPTLVLAEAFLMYLDAAPADALIAWAAKTLQQVAFVVRDSQATYSSRAFSYVLCNCSANQWPTPYTIYYTISCTVECVHRCTM